MNSITIMLEDMKIGTFDSYSNYLSEEDLSMLRKWFLQVTTEPATIETIISFLYELYINEDIDFRPYNEYTRIVTALANKYHFDSNNFLNIYLKYKELTGIINQNSGK